MSFSWTGSQDLFTKIDLIVQPGEIILITGDNGTGKTTLLNLLSGLLKPTKGSITWCDRDMYHQPRQALDTMIYIKQKAEDNLIGITPRHEISIWQMAYPQLFTESAVEEVISRNGLKDLMDHPIGSLSSGELRRLAMAPLALMTHRFWLLDEPLSGLDAQYIEFYATLIKNKISNSGNVIISSHDDFAVDYAYDRKWHITNNYIKEMTT